ncbi:MAG TPA: ferritin-like domain-containing protein [Stellaceae bacterium]|nr:ferritin-like domain-containing protein [Stellaceae bacterium]
MDKEFRYALPVAETGWLVDGASSTILRWDYDSGRAGLLALYDKGKRQQWNAAERIDWSRDLDPENPAEIADWTISIYGSDVWNRMTAKEQANLRRHSQAWQFSQFLHGEQGALVCCAKIVQQAPDLDAKFFAATQVMDEARHVEAYSRLLREKFELAFPITSPLQTLLDAVVRDGRWDMTYLGMQVLIEGLALAAFQLFRDEAKNPLAAAVNSYVMQDEARHVAFGRLALRDYYPQLTEAERREREEFVVTACYHMHDRFLADELWEAVGLPKAECVAIAHGSERLRYFRAQLFSRIVPMIRDIGLLGPEVKAAFADMGVLAFAEIDLASLLARDAEIAGGFDARRAGAAS